MSQPRRNYPPHSYVKGMPSVVYFLECVALIVTDISTLRSIFYLYSELFIGIFITYFDD